MSLLSTLDTLPRIWKFCLLVVGLFFFFGVHNLLQGTKKEFSRLREVNHRPSISFLPFSAFVFCMLRVGTVPKFSPSCPRQHLP